MSFFIGSYYLRAITTCNMSISGDDAIIGVNALLMGGRSIQFTPVQRSGGDREIFDVPDVEGYVSGLNRSLFLNQRKSGRDMNRGVRITSEER